MTLRPLLASVAPSPPKSVSSNKPAAARIQILAESVDRLIHGCIDRQELLHTDRCIPQQQIWLLRDVNPQPSAFEVGRC